MIIKSFGRFDADNKRSGQYGQIHFRKIRINAASTDKALLRIEVSLITRYAWAGYDDSLLDVDTIDPGTSVWKNYYTGTPGGAHAYKDGLRIHRKVGDVLGVVEFFVNRFNSLSDEQIKSIMVTSRCYLRSINGEQGCGKITKNRLRIGDHEKKDGGEPRLEVSGEKMDFQGLFGLCRTLNDSDDIPEGGFEDLFVLLKDDNEELGSIYRQFWTEAVADGTAQLGAANAYIPLGRLLKELDRTIRPLGPDHPMRYAIDADVRAAEMGTTHPLDSFLGPIGDRDRDFESSDSDIRRIANASPDYLRSVATYARLVHAVILESDVDMERKSIGLAFNADSVIRLCDPVLIDRSYPPKLCFTPGATGFISGYCDELRSRGYRGCGGCDMARANPEDDLAPEWPEVVANAGRMRDRACSDTPVAIRLLTDDAELPAGADPFHSIIVSTESDREACERFISAMPLPRSVSFLVFPSDEHYVEKRYDLFGITEVGVTGPTELLDLHRNGVDRRRKRARDGLDGFLDGREPDQRTVIGWALGSLVAKSDGMEEACERRNATRPADDPSQGRRRYRRIFGDPPSYDMSADARTGEEL